ncbi:MAG: hypothetical protein Q8S36_04515 [Sulfuricurvum sp.]|nr:hypothetical protein [Sulfuricurvum sp.]
MTALSSLDAYRSHELTMQMKTSSGDILSLNFGNTQELTLNSRQNDGTKESSFSFSSTQAFAFELNTNGITEQDQKEINAFMKKAQPYINKFMKELSDGEQKSPINKMASDLTKALGDLKHSDESVKNYAKKGVVDLFDNALKQTPPPKNENDMIKMVNEAEKFLKKIFESFDRLFEPLYA